MCICTSGNTTMLTCNMCTYLRHSNGCHGPPSWIGLAVWDSAGAQLSDSICNSAQAIEDCSADCSSLSALPASIAGVEAKPRYIRPKSICQCRTISHDCFHHGRQSLHNVHWHLFACCGSNSSVWWHMDGANLHIPSLPLSDSRVLSPINDSRMKHQRPIVRTFTNLAKELHSSQCDVFFIFSYQPSPAGRSVLRNTTEQLACWHIHLLAGFIPRMVGFVSFFRITAGSTP